MSLRGRITLASIVALGAALVILTVAINLLLAYRLDADASAVLRSRADAQRSTLDVSDGGLRVEDVPSDQSLDEQTWVFAASGAVVERAKRVGADVQRTAFLLAGATVPRERTVGGRVRLRAEPVYGIGGARLGTVVVGLSLVPYRHTKSITLLGTLVLDLFVLLGSVLMARRAVGAALRPVAGMTAQAAEWSELDLHRRFGLGPPRDELTGLAATLDGFLGRIDAMVRREQRFSAEMAHELRTPLSGVRAEAELALRADAGDADRRDALVRVLAGTDRMEAAIETLLTTARNDAAPSAGSCDPYLPVAEVVDALRPGAAAHGVTVAVGGEPGHAAASADAHVVAQAVHPLLENATRHARSRVDVAIGAVGGEVVVAVRDDGEGVAEADAERIFGPGETTAGGAGLGLSLARRLARSCGGEVVVVPGRGGLFELRVPEAGGFRRRA